MIALVFTLFVAQLDADRLAQVNLDRQRTNRDGMVVLNTWAAAFMISGSAGWLLADDSEWRAFHQANFVWNLVNAGLGFNGILQSYADVSTLTLAQSREASQSTQVSYLVNGGLDLVYLSVGAVLLWRGHADGSPRLKGWGKAVLLQAAFLLMFDLAMFAVNSVVGAPLRAGTGSAF